MTELPTPYYDVDGIQIYLGDCREILPHLPKVDLVLTDPPYGINLDTDFTSMQCKFKGKQQGNKYERIINDEILMNIQDLLTISSELVLFGADYFIRQLPESGTINVWDKRNETLDNQFGSCFEIIWHKRKCKRKFYRYKWAGIFGMEHEPTGVRVHPTQKPQRLIQFIIQEYNECDTILDPFMGSGTTLVAAKQLGRKAIGIEIEEKYCAIAVKRLGQGVLAF